MNLKELQDNIQDLPVTIQNLILKYYNEDGESSYFSNKAYDEFYSLIKDTPVFFIDIYTKEDLENLKIQPSQNCIERDIKFTKEYFLTNEFIFKKNIDYKGYDTNCFEAEDFLNFHIMYDCGSIGDYSCCANICLEYNFS